MAPSLQVPAALLILILLPALVVESQPSSSNHTIPAQSQPSPSSNNSIIVVPSQPSPSSKNDNNNDNSYTNFGTTNFSSSTAVVIVVLLSAFFFLAFFSIYIRQCNLGRSSSISGAATARVFAEGAAGRRGRGLDASILETFPTFPYSEVKELKFGKEALECAVCLSEFSDDETLRLLPVCSHVFHPDCIDVWLASHVTCPVCRTNLAAPPVEPPVEEESSPADDVAINVEDEAAILPRRFGRSHTTGHSVAASPAEGACVDRHTLRLPEHVRKVIMEAGRFRRATSCIGFAEGGEASARRGYRSMGARSERWGAALVRAMSMRVPAWAGRRGEAEESVKKGEGSFRGGAFDCLGGGTSATTDDEESSTVAFARV